FIDVYGFIITGLIFIPLLFVSGQWARLVPTSWTILPQAWAAFVHYANFHFPPEPNGFYAYNPLQQLSYFFVVFVFAPISIVAGAAMSPAMVNRFPWFPRLFGGRQGARSIHFLMMLCWVGFLVVHVTLVILTGFARNMNHIVLGTDNNRSDRKARGPLHPLPDDALLGRVSRRARHPGDSDRIRAKHEPHRSGYGQ